MVLLCHPTGGSDEGQDYELAKVGVCVQAHPAKTKGFYSRPVEDKCDLSSGGDDTLIPPTCVFLPLGVGCMLQGCLRSMTAEAAERL